MVEKHSGRRPGKEAERACFYPQTGNRTNVKRGTKGVNLKVHPTRLSLPMVP